MSDEYRSGPDGDGDDFILEDPESVLNDLSNYAVDMILDDPHVQETVTLIAESFIGRRALFDEAGEDREYFAASSLVFQKMFALSAARMVNFGRRRVTRIVYEFEDEDGEEGREEQDL